MIALLVISILLQLLTLCAVLIRLDSEKEPEVIRNMEYGDPVPLPQPKPAEKKESKPKFRTWSQIAREAEAKSEELNNG